MSLPLVSAVAAVMFFWWYTNSESSIILMATVWSSGIGVSALVKILSLGRRTDLKAQLERDTAILSPFSIGILSFAMAGASLIVYFAIHSESWWLILHAVWWGLAGIRGITRGRWGGQINLDLGPEITSIDAVLRDTEERKR